MHHHVKNLLGAAAAIAVLASGYAAWSAAASYGKSIQPSSFRSFTVTGNGTATSTPDVAEFSFQTVTQGGTDLNASQAANTEAMNKAIAFVKSQGVSDSDIKTSGYDIQPRYETYDCSPAPVPTMVSGAQGAVGASSLARPCPPPVIVGYTVTQTADVKVRDFGKIGGIMDGIVKNGANQVGALSFTVDNPTALQAAARADAIGKARDQAAQIAQAGGFRVGRLLSVQQGGYPIYDAAGIGGGIKASAISAAVPSIQPGAHEVNVAMTLQYEIE